MDHLSSERTFRDTWILLQIVIFKWNVFSSCQRIFYSSGNTICRSSRSINSQVVWISQSKVLSLTFFLFFFYMIPAWRHQRELGWSVYLNVRYEMRQEWSRSLYLCMCYCKYCMLLMYSSVKIVQYLNLCYKQLIHLA